MAKGNAAPEVEHAYTQARALCQQMGETSQLVPALLGPWRYYVARPQLHTALEFGETLLRLAQCARDSAISVVAYYALGVTWLYPGALLLPARTWRKSSPSTRQTSAVLRSTLATIWVLAAESMLL